MPSRYAGKNILINTEEQYKEYMRQRGVRYIRQFASPNIRFPTLEELEEIETIGHIWKLGDRFYKLADHYYNDVGLWWIIPWFNQKPTEFHFVLGDIVEVPFPLTTVLRIARV